VLAPDTMVASRVVIDCLPAVSLWIPAQLGQLKKADVEKCTVMKVPNKIGLQSKSPKENNDAPKMQMVIIDRVGIRKQLGMPARASPIESLAHEKQILMSS
jgi:hypothetical protein